MRYRFAVFAVVVGTLATAASAQAFVAALQAPTHRPHAGKRWPIKVSAHRKNGKRLHASAYYQFVYQGQVVQSCSLFGKLLYTIFTEGAYTGLVCLTHSCGTDGLAYRHKNN